jgi:hypothetical protein
VLNAYTYKALLQQCHCSVFQHLSEMSIAKHKDRQQATASSCHSKFVWKSHTPAHSTTAHCS